MDSRSATGPGAGTIGVAGTGEGADLDVAGLLVTIVGLALTVWQAVLARSASDRARAAADDIATRLGDLLLFSLLPQLRAAEADLRYARVVDDRALAIRVIVKWRDVASDVAGLLSARGLATKRDDDAVATCTALAHHSEDLLVQSGVTVHEAAAALLREVGTLSLRLGKVSARLLVEARNEPVR